LNQFVSKGQYRTGEFIGLGKPPVMSKNSDLNLEKKEGGEKILSSEEARL